MYFVATLLLSRLLSDNLNKCISFHVIIPACTIGPAVASVSSVVLWDPTYRVFYVCSHVRYTGWETYSHSVLPLELLFPASFFVTDWVTNCQTKPIIIEWKSVIVFFDMCNSRCCASASFLVSLFADNLKVVLHYTKLQLRFATWTVNLIVIIPGIMHFPPSGEPRSLMWCHISFSSPPAVTPSNKSAVYSRWYFFHQIHYFVMQ